MKNKLLTFLNVVFSILLTFGILASTAVITAEQIVKSPDHLLTQIERTNTYGNAYNSLKKKFSDNASVTSVPAELYDDVFTEEWVKNAVDEQVKSSFAQLDDSTVTADIDYSGAADALTGYFEEYAHEKHVIKDEVYSQKLEDTIENAKKTAGSAIDVYQLESIKRANLWSKFGKARDLASKAMPICIAVTAVIAVILIFLKEPLYWIGTAAFASGCILTIPMIYIKASKIIMKFSVKEFTTYTLVTGTLSSLADTVMYCGIAAICAGLLFMTVGVVLKRKKEVRKSE